MLILKTFSNLKFYRYNYYKLLACHIFFSFNILAFDIGIPQICTVKGKNGTCMFTSKCKERKGYVLGTCRSGFFFGACCADEAVEGASDLSSNFQRFYVKSVSFTSKVPNFNGFKQASSTSLDHEIWFEKSFWPKDSNGIGF